MRVIASTCLVIGMLGMTGCVSSGTHVQTLAELEQARKDSAKTVADFDSFKKQSAAQISALEEEKTKLSNDLLAAQTATQKVQRELDQTRSSLEAALASRRDMEEDARKIRAEASEMERLNGELRRERDLLRSKGEELQRSLDTSKQEFDTELKAEQATIAALQREKQRGEALAAEKQSLAADKEALVAEKERLGMERAAKEAEIQRLTKTQEDLTKSLQAQIDKGDIKIKQVRDRLAINMVEKVLFDSGHAQVKPDGLKVLKQVADVLKTVNDKQIRIEGHTDNVPIGGKLKEKFPTNWELSTTRATNVVRYFIEQGGVNRENFEAVGYADTKPVASNETDAGRAENRRIEIVLFPKDLGTIVGDIKP